MSVDFAPAPELETIRDAARRFADEALRPRVRQAESARAPDPEVRARFRETGLAQLELPESLGGAGLGARARALVGEELAAADAGAALALDPLGPALYPVLELGGEAAVERHLLPLLGPGDARAVLAWDPTPLLVESGGEVSGVLPWLPADRIDRLVALEKERAYVVDEGVECTPLRGAGLRAAGACEVRVEAAPVRASWVSTPCARRSLARARLYAAGLLVGVMRAAADYATAYARERVAFGRPVAHHQGVAFLIADLHTAVAASRCLLWHAADRIDHGEDAFGACAEAFLDAAERAMFVTPAAVQILGGHGFMQDHPVEKYMREARVLGLLLGGVDAAADDAARDLVDAQEPLALAGPAG